MTIKFSNNAYSTFAGGIASGDTSFACQAGHGDRFPVVASPDIAYITFEDSGGNREVVKVTARGSGSDTFTIVRAQDNTTARAWLAGDVVEQRIVALELDRFENLQQVDASDSKTTPGDADLLGLIDSAASNALKKLTWANLKATLKTYFDTLYAKVGAVTGGGITMSTERLLGRTTASTGAVEEITVSTGLSLTGGALSCTVTSDVTSVVGQTGAVTATQVRDALLAVDGAGSGLDADLLDGQSSAYYATAASVTAKAGVDVGSLGVGCYVLAAPTTVTAVAPNGSAAGSSLYAINPFASTGTAGVSLGSALGTGTWKNVGKNNAATTTADGFYYYTASIFQRTV